MIKSLFSITPFSVFVVWIFLSIQRISLSILLSKTFIFTFCRAVFSSFREGFKDFIYISTFFADKTYPFSSVMTVKAFSAAKNVSVVFGRHTKRILAKRTNFIRSFYSSIIGIALFGTKFLPFVVSRDFLIAIHAKLHDFLESIFNSRTKTILTERCVYG